MVRVLASRARWSVLEIAFWLAAFASIFLLQSKHLILTEIAILALFALSLDLLHPEPELIGREIRNHLEAAGIRERRCVVAVPASWVMSQHTALPELSSHFSLATL